MNNISCLIFDFDGVIADTNWARFQILKKILIDYDIFLETKDLQNLIGCSTKSFLKTNFSKLSEKDLNEIINKRHREYLSNLNKYCIPFKDMSKIIQQLYKKYDLAIVTTNTYKNIKIQLQHLKIYNYFKWIIGREYSEDDFQMKTYKKIPTIIRKKVKECIVIEDSEVGITSAKKTGYYCIKFNPYKKKDTNDEKYDDMAFDYIELKNKIIWYSTS